MCLCLRTETSKQREILANIETAAAYHIHRFDGLCAQAMVVVGGFAVRCMGQQLQVPLGSI